MIAPSLACDARFREQFLAESRIAATLEHPHVVPVFDAGEEDDTLYIAMRYVRGSDLESLLRGRGPLAPEVVVGVADQLASALHAAHSQGVAHGDVKPANVLVGEDSEGGAPYCYLTDFGLAEPLRLRASGDAGPAGTLGSIAYLAPERIGGERPGAAADVYSLACMLYECLTGQAPFQRESDEEVLYAHTRAERPRPSDHARVGADVDSVFAAALAPDPEQRPADATELARMLARAVGATRVAAASPVGSATRHRSGIVPEAPVERLVGRVPEETLLLSALGETLHGRGGFVLLSGEAGIGKTTLAARAAAEAARRGVRAVWGRGGAFGEAPPPYWHWQQVARALVRADGGAELLASLGPSARWLTAVAPDLSGLVSDGAPTDPLDAGQDGRFQLYDALALLLARAAGAAGLLVLLDDLQLADEASLQALGFVGTLIRESPVLIVGTWREGGGGAARERPESRLAELSELAGPGRRMGVRAMDSAQVGSLIALHAGGEAPRWLVGRIHEVSGGNPLFASELTRLLLARGGLETAPERLGELPLPAAISDTIAARLAPLPAQARECLEAAAVIGTSFRAATLARVTGLPAGELLGLLDAAMEAGVLEVSDEGTDAYTFSHGLVRTTIYEALPRAARCALHDRVAQELEADYDVNAGEGLAEIAFHLLEAAAAGATGERAVEFALRAAERAAATYAYDDAVTLYARAIGLIGADAGERRTRLLLLLGETQMRAGDTQAAHATLQRAAASARASGDAASVARAALASNIWGLTLGVDRPLVDLAEEAVSRLEGSDNEGLRASVMGLLASALYWSEQSDRRHRLAGEALALARAEHARAADDESARVLAYVIGRVLLARWGPESAVRDMVLSEELLRLCEQLRDAELEILTRNWRVTELLELGQFAAVDQEIARVEAMAKDLRQPRAMVFLPLHHGSRAGTAGRFAEAERLNAESGGIGHQVRGTVGELAAFAQLLALRHQQGRLPELEAPVRAITASQPGMLGMQAVLALILVQTGRPQEGAAELGRLLSRGLDGFPKDNVHIVTLAMMGEVAVALPDAASSRQLLAWMSPYAGRWVVSAGASALWPVDRSLARLALTAGDLQTAALHLARAREMALRGGAAPSLALAALDEALLLLASGRESELPRARALAREARIQAQELGMSLVADQATILEGTGEPE